MDTSYVYPFFCYPWYVVPARKTELDVGVRFFLNSYRTKIFSSKIRQYTIITGKEGEIGFFGGRE